MKQKTKNVVLAVVLILCVLYTAGSKADAASYKRLVDVSSHNGTIDWTKVKNSGISAAILRAGYGKNTVDAQFRRNATNANKVGMPIGIYWFSYAYTVNQAKQEAKKCIETIKQYKITLPVFFDWEYDSMRYAKQYGVTPDKYLITEMHKAFCEEIDKAGYTAGIYYNRDYKNNHIYVNQLTKYVQWYAYYNSKLDGTKCDLWQYGEGTGVPGIYSSRVDKNYLINDSLLSKINKPTKQTTQAKKTTTKKKIDVTYAVKTASRTYTAVKNCTDFAGVKGKAITGIKIKVSSGTVKYRVHIKNGKWLPWVTGYNWNDYKNGYAGNGKEIDAVQAILNGKNEIVYKTSQVKKVYTGWQWDNNTDNGLKGYSGKFGKSMDRLQMRVKVK